MKNNKASFKSFRKKVVSKEGVDAISPGIRHGETLIPKGSSIATIELPETKETFTYEIINSDSMTGDIKIAATEGSLKGLILNSNGGNLSVSPVPTNCKQVLFETTIKDGSYIETLSDGSDWFLWSFGVGNGLGVSTNTYIRGNIGLIGGGSGTVFESIILGPTYEPVSILTSVITVEYPGGVATHDILFGGTAEPGSTLKIFDISNTLIGTVDPVATDGSWSFAVSGLTNGPHKYTFKAFVGVDFINQSPVWSELLNGGLISFSCSQIQVEVGSTTPDFATEPVIYHQDSNGVQTPITDTTVVSTTYSDASAAGTTFDVVFEFTYDSVTYQRTVTGNTIVNLVQPAPPTISTVDGNASGVPISVTTADISGTALPNADVIVWVDGESTSTPVPANGAGQWTISSYNFGFTNNQAIVLYAQQQTVNGTLWSNNSAQFDVVYQQNVLAQPAVTDIAGLTSGGFTNNSNPLTINGTGVIGSTVTLASGGSTLIATPSTITVGVTGLWTASLPNLSDETLHTITAQQSKAGFTQSQQSTGFIINVDRTPPVLAAVLATTLYLPNTTDTLPAATDFSSVVVTAAYIPPLVSAEGDYTATYTATDAAGNTAQNSRTISVTTQVIVPTSLVVTDNGDGTATITGTVTGTYADNLDVKIYVTDSHGLEEVYQESGTAVKFDVNSGTFSAPLTLSTDTYTFQATTTNSEDEESVPSAPTSQVSITAPVVTVSSFLEEFTSATNNLAGAAAITNDVFIRNASAQGYTYVDLDADGIFSYTNGVRTNIETTLSFWLKFDEPVGAGPNILGWNDGGLNGPDDFAIRVGQHTGGNIQFVPAIGNLGVGTNYASAWTISPVNNGPAYSSRGSLWNHYALVYKYNGSTYDLKIYINGDVVGTALNKTFEINKNASQSLFGIGAGRYNSISQSVYDTVAEHTRLSLDSIQIADGTALTDNQVTAIYNQPDRLMTIEAAAAINPAYIEDSSNFTLFGNSTLNNVAGNLIYNHSTSGTGNYATGKWSDGLTHDGSQFSYTSYTLSFWVKFNTLPALSEDVFIFSARDANHNGLEFMMDTAGNGSKTLQVYHSDDGTNNTTRQLTEVLTLSQSSTQFQNVWINFVAVVSNGDANLNVYINESLRRSGQPTGYSDARINGAKYVNDVTDADSTFTIGRKWDGNEEHTVDIEIDSIQIMENVILTEAQANAIAADSTRQMTIETASAISPYIEQNATKFNGAAYTSCTLSLDGTNDYATVSSGFRYTDFLSISLWFKTSNTTSRRIISSHTAGIGNNGFFVGISSGKLFYRAPNMTGQQNNLGSGLANNGWHHLVLTWQPGSGNRKLYIDNSLIHSLSGGSTVTGYVPGENLYIGAIYHATNGPYEFFDGEIARVEVLNEVLDFAAVTTRYNDGDGSCP